ncbi:hypothetical protein PBRA_007685 [Plasmodiophora brassicae]|nr:hypothetical protein PBRA_007685 [Plasmodiophora brassicae]
MVLVKTLNGGQFQVDLEVDPSTPVDALKSAVAEANGTPPERQRIIFRGKVLKDGHLLAEYGVASDSVVHLVVRPDDAPSEAPATEPPQQQQQAQQGMPAANSGVFVSTVNIGDGEALPDFNMIVNRMLSSISSGVGLVDGGIALGAVPIPQPSQPPIPTPAQQQQQQPSSQQQQQHRQQPQRQPVPAATPALASIDAIRQQLNTVAGTVALPSAVIDLRLANDVPSLGQMTAQVHALLARLMQMLEDVQPVLQRPSQATDPTLRANTEQQSAQIGLALSQMVGPLSTLASALSGTRLGTAPGRESITFNASSSSSHPSIPPFVVNLPDAFAALGSSLQQSSSSASGAPAIDLQGMLQSVTGMISRAQNASRPPERSDQQGNAPPPPSAAPQQPPSATNRRPRSPSPARPHPSSSSSAPASNVAPAVDIMAQLMPMVSSILGSSGSGSGGGSLAELAASLMPSQAAASHDESQEMSPVESILSRVMSRLQMPDLFAMFSGNWSALQPLHGELREELFQHGLSGSDTPASRRQLTDELTAWLVGYLSSETALAPVASHLRPNAELAETSFDLIHPHVRGIVNLIMSEPGPSRPFAEPLQTAVAMAVGEWVDMASQLFDDGTTSVGTLLRGVVSEGVSSLGPEFSFLSTMASGAIATMMMRTHTRFLEQRALERDTSGTERWMRELPSDVAEEWQRTIDRDAALQRCMEPQRPFSDSYSEGHDSKRRKLAESRRAERNKPANTRASLERQVERAGGQPGNVTDELERAYRSQLIADLRERVLNDPDFEADRFPAIRDRIVDGKRNDTNNGTQP